MELVNTELGFIVFAAVAVLGIALRLAWIDATPRRRPSGTTMD
jgi:hypothetical protein